MSPKPNIYVAGFPRSGTSLLIKVCELLGVQMLYDNKINFELTLINMRRIRKIIETEYCGLKLVMPVLPVLYDLPAAYPSKVIFASREYQKCYQSQHAIRWKAYTPDEMFREFAEYKGFLGRHHVPYQTISFEDMLTDTEATIKQVAEFIESDRDISEAVRYVNPNLSRFGVATPANS